MPHMAGAGLGLNQYDCLGPVTATTAFGLLVLPASVRRGFS